MRKTPPDILETELGYGFGSHIIGVAVDSLGQAEMAPVGCVLSPDQIMTDPQLRLFLDSSALNEGLYQDLVLGAEHRIITDQR